MQIRQAQRKMAKIKLAIQGTSGSGKTYSSLLLAKGILKSNDLSKVCIIDTENGSADLYSHLGNYKVLQLNPPFTPEKYIEAIELCKQSNIELIIIDSISHAWEELLDYHSNLTGNSFSNWAKITPRQKKFIDAILQTDIHVIATMRTKQEYVLNQKDGKYIPEKVGLKAIQRDGLDYEFTIVFDIDINHNCKASKDRTNIFNNPLEFKINEKTGESISNWCNKNIEPEISIKPDELYNQLSTINSIDELYQLYNRYPRQSENLKADFEIRKNQILNSFNRRDISPNIN